MCRQHGTPAQSLRAPATPFAFCLWIMRVWIAEARFLCSRRSDLFPSSLVSHPYAHSTHLTPTFNHSFSLNVLHSFPFSYSHFHSLIPSHPHPFHPFIHLLSFPHPPSFIPSFPLSPTPHFIQSLSYPQPPSFLPSFLHTLTHTPLHPFIPSFSLLPTTSVLLSFLPSFLPSFPPSLPYLHL